MISTSFSPPRGPPTQNIYKSMFSSLSKSIQFAPRAQILSQSFRYLHASPVTWAKNKKGKSSAAANSASDHEVLALDIDAIESKFKSVVDTFNKHATEAKLGKTNPNIFDKLKINVDAKSKVPFSTVAQTMVQGGRNFVITVFDPSHTQEVINAVLGSGLNMNPQRDPSNKQTLKVPLPPPTVESKKDAAKHLKTVFENLKNNATTSRGAESTLASVRASTKDTVHKFVKKQKRTLSDAEKKLEKEFDDLHKSYSDKLTEAFKAAEKSILK